MTDRKIKQAIPALEVMEGAGVTVHRSLGTPALRNLDPFLMLDHFGSDQPDDYIAGFPDHPHRGFITLTYMIEGHMLHRDSMGNRGDLKSGGIQWMKAGSGVIHSEMPQQSDGLMRGFQLWINLPAKEKMSDPAYQDHPAERIPVVEAGGRRVKIISGEHGGKHGPIDDPHTRLFYLDVALEAEIGFEQALAPDHTAFLYIYEGALAIGATNVAAHHFIVLGPGERVALSARGQGARFILVAGRPLGEPIAQGGPFVMNSEQEVRRAFEDYKAGRLVHAKAG